MILNELNINTLILYDANSLFVNTIREHLESFRRYSQLRIHYHPATGNVLNSYNLFLFDVIVIHYSVRLSLSDHLASSFAEQIKSFGGYKVLFIQDEYDTTETARNWIEKLGIHCVYTCVPLDQLDKVYPKERFKSVDFLPTLTGYVPSQFENLVDFIPLNARAIRIGYRGRELPYWYGNLGQEKLQIGIKMKHYCKEKNIKVDIETNENKRIYGENWYSFLKSSRATLGTESGSNIFDDNGTIRASIEAALKVNPTLSYADAFELYLKSYEGKVKMNQVSPKIFESIACGTALILYEGDYSGVIQADRHYIPLKKDFSNIDVVLEKLEDLDYLSQLTQTAYREVVGSGKYSYRKFIQDFDQYILKRLRKPIGKELLLVDDLRLKGYACNEKINKIRINFLFFRNTILKMLKKYLPGRVVNLLRKIYTSFGFVRLN